VGPLTRRWPQLSAALAAGVLITGSTPSSGGALTVPAEAAPDLKAQADALGRSESAALLQLYAAESSLTRAQADLSRLEERSSQLAEAEAGVRRQTEIVRRSLSASQARVAVLLRDLYVQGEPDPIAVILGATSLDEAMAGIEGLSRATVLNERLGIEAEQRARRLEHLRAHLAAQRESLNSARSAANAGAERLAAAFTGRRETLTSLRRRRSLTAQRLTALQSRAREAERRSADITAIAAQGADASSPATPGTPDAPPAATGVPSPAMAAAPAGTRTLVVDAVAYHLQGTTASGLPVGLGVIAVDPIVIPLGTRVNVPGYGPAVAADVGPAVKGNIIDLWMPSTARARLWGRRTVTITVYG
jgi:3D (Asp-Asp-Asp) domain-containing protein